MGFYYEQRPPDRDDEQNPGCLDALVISRAILQVLFWPVIVLVLVVLDIAVTFVLFTIHPALALIPIGVTVAAVYLFARWEQQHFRPPDLPHD